MINWHLFRVHLRRGAAYKGPGLLNLLVKPLLIAVVFLMKRFCAHKWQEGREADAAKPWEYRLMRFCTVCYKKQWAYDVRLWCNHNYKSHKMDEVTSITPERAVQ